MWVCLRGSRGTVVPRHWGRSSLNLGTHQLNQDAKTFHSIVVDLKTINNKKLPNTSYSKWIKTKHVLEERQFSLSKNSSHLKLSSNCFNIYSKNNFNDSISNVLFRNASLSNHIHLSSRLTHTDSPKRNLRNVIKTPEGRLGEVDPFNINDDEDLDSIHNRDVSKNTLPQHSKRIRLPPRHKISEKEIETAFPNPLATLNNYQSTLQKKVFEISYKHFPLKTIKLTKASAASWTCRIKLLEPEIVEFEGQNTSKAAAAKSPFLKLLHWLYTNKHINEAGLPIHSEEIISNFKVGLNQPNIVNIPKGGEDSMKKLIETYRNDIEPLVKLINQDNKKPNDNLQMLSDVATTSELMEEEGESENIYNWDFASGLEYNDPIFGTPHCEKDKELVAERSSFLLNKLEKRSEESHLPITDYRQDIIRTIDQNRAVVISGAPGCGKSTRVPSYLLDDWIERNVGGYCDILISQPRRVAALSLANRVANERHEKVGDVCGYQVRLSTKLSRPPGGAILFCTAGALLRRFTSTPDLPGCTHLIIDEAHERSADSDAVITLSKRAMSMNPDLKLIVMSATLDTDLFSRYLGNCPILNVPGLTHPVKSYFLEDMPKEVSLYLRNAWRASNFEDSQPILNPNEVVTVIKWVHRVKDDGAILVFLPGWGEIKKVKDILENNIRSSECAIFPIHSKLSNEDQQKIFSHLPPGIRKIILATNIAETSITINDVSYVIDTGIQKENKIINDQGLSSLVSDWVSKANVKQRMGRAGRVKSGECFHMYSRQKLQTFNDNPTPEILRLPLEKIVLDCKLYNANDKAVTFLQKFPQPPSTESIEVAVKNLVNMGALDLSENLTALGKRIATFTTHPKLSKALVHSVIFKVASPVLDISTVLSNNHELFVGFSENKEDIRNLKKEYHPSSDHQAIHWVNEEYQNIKKQSGYLVANAFCKERFLRKEKLDSLQSLRELSIGHLVKCKMLNDVNNDGRYNLENEDEFSTADELCKGVLLSGLNTFLHLKASVKTVGKLAKINKFLTENGQTAFLSSESINYKLNKMTNSAILLYCGAVHSQERRGVLVKDSSLISPLTVFLFSSQIDKLYQDGEKAIFGVNNGRIRLECSLSSADTLWEFRKTMWSIVQFYVENQGFNNFNSQNNYSKLRNDSDSDSGSDNDDDANISHQKIQNFRDSLLTQLAKILTACELQSHEQLKLSDVVNSNESK
ncbi:ATP-dependent DNA/RNA helicase DHX36-like [Arctopsyche grandis]|uniref:ATP-dependent DNA/RNA helicase DHX36-like n=1 Tax=Arctopsyche grandis TaxID=121162 RepID=UPI00406D86DB